MMPSSLAVSAIYLVFDDIKFINLFARVSPLMMPLNETGSDPRGDILTIKLPKLGHRARYGRGYY